MANSHSTLRELFSVTFRLFALWFYDVREQLCRRRAALLVLYDYSLVWHAMALKVKILYLLLTKNLQEISCQKGASRIIFITFVAILATVRIIRRWNQTGQKWAGEPDISQTFFSNHKLTFWALICATYLWNMQSLASRGFPRFSQVVAGAIATALATAAITFKLAFTSEDSPELMAGPAKTLSDNELGVSLVIRARIVFSGLTLTLLYTIITGFGRPRRHES